MTQLSITFDSKRAEKLAEEGIAKAEANQQENVALARDFAEDHARLYGTVTADDVRRHFDNLDLPWLGPAAGSLFKDSRFEFTGRYVKSSAVARHGGLIRVWKLA